MNLFITGGRNFNGYKRFWAVLDEFRKAHQVSFIVQGGCKTGADKFARDYAEYHEIPYITYPANFQGRNGKKSGPIRNTKMAAIMKPADYCIAFWDEQSTGTADMRMKAIDKVGKDHVITETYKP